MSSEFQKPCDQSQRWWLLPVIKALQRLRQQICHNFEANLGYIARACLKRKKERNPVTNYQLTNKTKYRNKSWGGDRIRFSKLIHSIIYGVLFLANTMGYLKEQKLVIIEKRKPKESIPQGPQRWLCRQQLQRSHYMHSKSKNHITPHTLCCPFLSVSFECKWRIQFPTSQLFLVVYSLQQQMGLFQHGNQVQ